MCMMQDYPCLGRILMFRVKHDTSTGVLSQQEMLYSREFRGPITAIEAMEKCLLVAMGSKLLLHYWDGERLTEAAFFDAPLLITSVNVIKVRFVLWRQRDHRCLIQSHNILHMYEDVWWACLQNFILLGDIHKSVSFIRYVEKAREGQVGGRQRAPFAMASGHPPCQHQRVRKRGVLTWSRDGRCPTLSVRSTGSCCSCPKTMTSATSSPPSLSPTARSLACCRVMLDRACTCSSTTRMIQSPGWASA